MDLCLNVRLLLLLIELVENNPSEVLAIECEVVLFVRIEGHSDHPFDFKKTQVDFAVLRDLNRHVLDLQHRND